MSAMGHQPSLERPNAWSALPLKADLNGPTVLGRLVPQTDLAACRYNEASLGSHREEIRHGNPV
jgi:hypothetical protein